MRKGGNFDGSVVLSIFTISNLYFYFSDLPDLLFSRNFFCPGHTYQLKFPKRVNASNEFSAKCLCLAFSLYIYIYIYIYIYA
jgi:hypothetical protein